MILAFVQDIHTQLIPFFRRCQAPSKAFFITAAARQHRRADVRNDVKVILHAQTLFQYPE
ncbi:MAG: hypothetical protein IT462_10530 [Planctomycetes bacterium]|nr:hypothetical protein [Planctomycetota bacterium]